MRYAYVCKSCDEVSVLSRSIEERDEMVTCKCGEQMTRAMSAASYGKQSGCMLSAERDGHGCLIDEYGRVRTPKTRGSKYDRQMKERKRLR